MAKFTKSGGAGGRKGRSTKSKSDKSSDKSGWQRPDGRELRARKGDFFPDDEIARRKKSKGFTPKGPDSERPSDEGTSPRPFRGRDEKPAFRSGRGDDRPKRAYGDRDERPKRAYGDRDERPKRTYGDRDERPKRTYGDRDERPKRTYGDRDERPKRTYGDRDERPKRSFGDRDERPKRTYDDRDERPKRSFGDRDERPKRTYGDRDEAADRSFDRGDERKTRPYGSRDERPSGGYGDRGPKRDSRRDDKPKKRFGMQEQREAGFKRMDRDQKHAGERQYRKTSSDRPSSGTAKPAKPRSEDGSSRLNKFIANTGLCSRREADELIEAGVITVNGEVVTALGSKVMPGDDVRYNGEPLRSEKLVYVLLNKPKDFITTTEDPEERKTVMSLVEDACRERIYPVGRLDRNTTGLLLLTNDGDLTKKLTHPSYKVKKVYHVELDRNLTAADMRTISEGVELEDGPMQVDEIAYASPDDKSQVGVELHSGKNRIVRRIFESLGYQVKKLDRTVFAGLNKKDLPRGRWRMLTEMEVNMLKMATGSKKPKN